MHSFSYFSAWVRELESIEEMDDELTTGINTTRTPRPKRTNRMFTFYLWPKMSSLQERAKICPAWNVHDAIDKMDKNGQSVAIGLLADVGAVVKLTVPLRKFCEP